MTICQNISPKKRKICAGDLRLLINIQTRAVKSNGFDDPDYGETFTEVKQVYASIQTTRGFQSFDGVGVNNNVTHKIYIRFDSTLNISADDWVEFENDKYDIVDVENLEERNEFFILYCMKKGSETLNANLT